MRCALPGPHRQLRVFPPYLHTVGSKWDATPTPGRGADGGSRWDSTPTPGRGADGGSRWDSTPTPGRVGDVNATPSLGNRWDETPTPGRAGATSAWDSALCPDAKDTSA